MVLICRLKYLFSDGQKLNSKKFKKIFIFWFWIESRKAKVIIL